MCGIFVSSLLFLIGILSLDNHRSSTSVGVPSSQCRVNVEDGMSIRVFRRLFVNEKCCEACESSLV